MTAATGASDLEFPVPGPGSWTIDAVHFPRPVTPYWAALHPEPFRRGVAEYGRFYGMVIGPREIRYVNGFSYGRTTRLPEGEIPARLERAEEVWAKKLWREQLREWDETLKPASIKRHQQLQAVNADALSDKELVAHLTRCRQHHSDMVFQHMRFTAAPSVPTGDFLAHARDWTGLPVAKLLGLLRGAAPISAGESDELGRLRAAIGQEGAARQLLASGSDPGEILQQLRTMQGEAGAAASAYLDLVGYRLLDGFDIAGRYALELPDQLLRAIRVGLEGKGPQDADLGARVAEVRDRVPDAHQNEFDELLAEARLTYRIRDERGVYSDIWAAGIMRRGVLAAGRRLSDRGRIHDPEDLVDAEFEEMCALLTGTNGPSAGELANRRAQRQSRTAKDAPRLLGDPPAPPSGRSGLPVAAARVMRAMGIVSGQMFGTWTEEQAEHLIRGLPASPGVYEGIARRVGGPTEFHRIVPGDILVTESTSEAFNILLPLLGGIVTDAGGLLSHAAITAREYGIPGVVGTREATTLIPNGARVRIDGVAGEVTVLP